MATAAIQAEAPIENLGQTASKISSDFSTLQNSVAKFGGGVRTFSSDFNKVYPAANKTSDSLKKLSPATNRATGDLINLGRVVQDAPFGFIGIANNLNPLIEGFSRTAKEAGGFRGTLKALGGALAGAGGISLGISLVSSALVLFGDRLFGSSKAAKALDESTSALAKKFADQAVTLTTLVGIVQNVNSSYEDKKKALKALNQEYATYLDALGKEEINANNIAAAYERIVDALIRQAVVKGIQEQISQAVEQTAKQLIKLQVAHEQAAIAAKQRQKAEQNTDSVKTAQNLRTLSASIEQYQRGATDGILAQQGFNREQINAADNVKFYNDRVKQLKDTLLSQLAPLLNLTTNFEDLNIKLDKGAKKVKEFREEMQALKDLGTIDPAKGFIIKELNIRGIKIPSVPEPEIKKISDQLQKAVDEFTKNNPILLRAKLESEKGDQRRKSFFSALGLEDPEAEDPLSNAQKGVINLANSVRGVLTPAFNDFFTAIRKGVNPIKAFFEAIGQAILDTIQKFIQAAIVAAIFNAILGGNSPGFGSLFKQFAGFRAAGGPVSAGKSYVVGENGPELFTPNTGGRIIPNNKTAGTPTAAFGGMQLISETRVSGDSLLYLHYLTLRKQGRLNG